MMSQDTGPRLLTVRIGSQELSIQPDLTYTIGHSEDNDIRIVHGSVSAQHAWISYREGMVHIKDLDSIGGTWVAGQRVESNSFLPGSASLRIGEIDLELALGNPTALILPQFQSTPLSHRRSESFKEIMATELRRAPWLTVSAVLHALLIWLLYLLAPEPPKTNTSVFATILSPSIRSEIEAVGDAIDEPIEIEQVDAAEQALQDLDIDKEAELESEAPSEELNPLAYDFSKVFGSSDALFERVQGKSSSDVLNLDGDNKLSGGFKKTVTKLRKSGLEMIFVFDSTGSMNPVLEATKQHVERMVGVLHFLVPESRMGIVTYRDRGVAEEYLTRSVPLGSDYYRSVNFMQSVGAGGGGDTPEAVFEALEEAINQNWQKGSKRVVVLIGDAPAHAKTRDKIKRMVRRFTSNGRSFVHAIMTSPHSGRDVENQTKECFEDIAKAGKGSCIFLEEEQKILQHVFSLAIGNEYRDNIEEVYQIAESRERKISTRALDLVRRLDFTRIERELRKNTVPDDLVRALSRKRDRDLAIFLVSLLRRGKFPATGREAAAYALKRILDLEVPPIDSDTGGAINRRTEAWLRRRVDQRF